MTSAENSRVSIAARFEILDLFARYSWALDTADLDALLDCFTTTGAIIRATNDAEHRHEGRAELKEFFGGLFSQKKFIGRQHHVDQMVFSPGSTPNTVRIRSYAFVTELHPDLAPAIFFAGYYEDVCVDHGNVWKFQARRYAPWSGEVLRRFPRPSE